MTSVLAKIYDMDVEDLEDLPKIHVWYGTRRELIAAVRGVSKSKYKIINSTELAYSPGADNISDPEQQHRLPHGSYNLFHHSSSDFFLITEVAAECQDYGDGQDRFTKALLAYCLVDDIMLPRMWGRGAPKIKNRIPLVILAESDKEVWMTNGFKGLIWSVPVSDLVL